MGFGEGGGQEEAFFTRRQAGAHGEGRGEQEREHDEAADTDGPAEGQGRIREHLGEGDGKDDTAEGGAGDGDADGGAAAFVEVLACGGEAGRDGEAHADATKDALGEHELIVLLADAGHEDSEEVSEHGGPNRFGAEAIEHRAADETAGEEAEDLDGADPGDGGRGMGGELVAFVVFLENAADWLDRQFYASHSVVNVD